MRKVGVGDTVKLSHYSYDGQVCKVLGLKSDGMGEDVLVQLSEGSEGHKGNNFTLNDGRRTSDMNLKNVYWVHTKNCEIVKPKSEYPYYGKSVEGYPAHIVKFTKNAEGEVVYSKHPTHPKGYHSTSWAMSCFDKITDEEYENIKNEEKTIKYKVLKNISGDALREANACRSEFNRFTLKYGYYNNVDWTEENEKFIIEQNGWIDFLLKYKFIKKIEQNLVYDSSLLYFYISSDKLFKVNSTNYGSNFNLICISTDDNSYQTFDKTWEEINHFVNNNNDLAKSEVKGFSTLIDAVTWFNNKI